MVQSGSRKMTAFSGSMSRRHSWTGRSGRMFGYIGACSFDCVIYSSTSETDSNRHRVSPLRHLALPPIHHQRPRIHQLHRATPDGTDLHHSFCPGSSSSMVQRSSGKAVSVYPRVYVHHGSRLHHVCCERDSRCHLCWRVYRCVRLVPGIPWKHHLAQQ
jgi:hypothetical protein